MKKVLVIFVFLIGSGIYAQPGGGKQFHSRESRPELTTEQRATIQSKRMTLALGLDTPQQAQLENMLKKHLSALSEFRDNRASGEGMENSGTPPTRFERLNQRLDRQIAFQEELKGILTERQFARWSAHREQKKPQRKHRYR